MLATDPTWGLVVGLMVLTALLFLYLLPTYIAYRRRHHQAAPIAVINICFGWTFLGWVAALAWSVSAVRA
jgi:hypothetical protein